MAESVANEAAAKVRRLIAEERMKPGQKLPSERVLCERLGVSRTSLRVALAELRAIGIIATYASRGAFVAEANNRTVPAAIRGWFEANLIGLSELIEFRRAVEPAATAAAASRRSDDDLVLLRKQLTRMREAASVDDPSEFSDADDLFHRGVAGASRNSLFVIMTEPIAEWLRVYRQSTARIGQGALLESFDQHVAIFEAIVRGQPTEAYRAAEEHIVASAVKFHLVDSSDVIPWSNGSGSGAAPFGALHS